MTAANVRECVLSELPKLRPQLKPFALPTAEDPALIIQGDALDSLKRLPDAAVQCVVTSPPYWGLRDYGTGEWEGGAANCCHQPREKKQGATGQRADRRHSQPEIYHNICGKCGALRSDRQIGLEATPEAYVAALVEVFAEVRRVLAADGTLWLNLGDSYASGELGRHDARSERAKEWGCVQMDGPRQSHKSATGLAPKNLCGIPWRVAFALQAAGWYLRADIIWAKPNPMPESVTDRPTKSHEYVFLLSKSARYWYDAEAIAEIGVNPAGTKTHMNTPEPRRAMGREPSGNEREGMKWEYTGTRNRRSVWNVATDPYAEAHFATFPPALIRPMILAGCPAGGVVLDPFAGSGTTFAVAVKLGRRAVGIELNPAYVKLIQRRLAEPLDIGGLYGAAAVPVLEAAGLYD